MNPVKSESRDFAKHYDGQSFYKIRMEAAFAWKYSTVA